MKRVLTAAALVPVVLLLVFRAPLLLFVLGVAALIVLTLHEYLSIAEAAGLKPFKWLTFSMALVPFALLFFNGLPIERQYNEVSFDLLFLPSWLSVFLIAAVVLGIPLVF